MKPITYTYHTLVRNKTRMVKCDPPDHTRSGYRSVPDGQLTGDIEITIYIEALIRSLGHKALGAKSKRATVASGTVKVKAVNVVHHPEGIQ